MRKILIGVFVLLVLITLTHEGKKIITGKKNAPATPSAAQALSYIEAQLGKPYLWGATGPDSFDCSGLVYAAYHLPWSDRTSQEQWANLPHVSSPVPGDLVYFTGLLNPGESPPGHVGVVIGSHEMIDAYGVGTGVVRQSFGVAGSPQGLTDPMGYSSP
jgi:cell wall-associated NlpC family hydrolase